MSVSFLKLAKYGSAIPCLHCTIGMGLTLCEWMLSTSDEWSERLVLRDLGERIQ